MEQDFNFELSRPQKVKYSEEEILSELEKVAEHFKYSYFRRKDFDQVAKIHSATVERHFNGSWSKAMKELEARLEKKNIDFQNRRRTRRNTSKQEIFAEMERIWRALGHRPSRSEWTSSNPKMSYDTVYRYFGGWTNACTAFVEFKTGNKIELNEVKDANKAPRTRKKKTPRKTARSKSVSLNIRMRILNRDNFRCVYCGRSPATHLDCKLHVDHIIPFSKGGSNSEENLQTLCEKCNLGKSNNLI